MTNAPAAITEAAALIAEFSPATASAFIARPFHRLALVEAFDAGFKAHSAYSRSVVAFALVAAKADVVGRAIEARR